VTHPLQQSRFRRIGASAVRAGVKSSSIANRKSTMCFPMSYSWSLYVDPNSPQRMAQKANLSFKNKFPYIYVIDEASDFKFGTQLGFAKAHYKITPRRKKWGWPLASGAPPNFGFPYNIFATAGASNFKFGMQLGFAKAHHKITRRRKGGRGPGLGDLPKMWGSPSIFTQWLKLATSNLVHS